MLCNEDDILVVVCRSAGSVCTAQGTCGCEYVFSRGGEQCVDSMQAVCWVTGC